MEDSSSKQRIRKNLWIEEINLPHGVQEIKNERGEASHEVQRDLKCWETGGEGGWEGDVREGRERQKRRKKIIYHHHARKSMKVPCENHKEYSITGKGTIVIKLGEKS